MGAVVGIVVMGEEIGGTVTLGVTDTPGGVVPCPAVPVGGGGADGSAAWACTPCTLRASSAHPRSGVQYSCERFALIIMGDASHPGNEVIVG